MSQDAFGAFLCLSLSSDSSRLFQTALPSQEWTVEEKEDKTHLRSCIRCFASREIIATGWQGLLRMLFCTESMLRVVVQAVGPKGGKQYCESWGAALEPILSAMQLLGVQTSSSSWGPSSSFSGSAGKG